MTNTDELKKLMALRAIDATVEDIARVVVAMLQAQPQEPQQPHYVRGLRGIMDIFQCSKTKAQSLRSSGLLDAAIKPLGRSYLVDADKALQLLK
jgi:hypothetical protein